MKKEEIKKVVNDILSLPIESDKDVEKIKEGMQILSTNISNGCIKSMLEFAVLCAVIEEIGA